MDFPFHKGWWKECQVTAVNLPVNYLWLLLDKSLRITDSERGRNVSRLRGTGTRTSCQQQALAPAVAWT